LNYIKALPVEAALIPVLAASEKQPVTNVAPAPAKVQLILAVPAVVVPKLQLEKRQ